MIPVIKKAWLYTFCLFLLTLGCTSVNSSNREDTPNNETSAPSGITISNADGTNELRDRIEQISQAAQGRVGVTAIVLETGESVTLNGNQQWTMQSVYKFPIAMAVLAQVDQGKLKLDQKIRVEASDVLQGSRILDEKSQGIEFSIIKDSHKYREPMAFGLREKAIITNREFLLSRRIGLMTVGEGATDFVALGELNQDKEFS